MIPRREAGPDIPRARFKISFGARTVCFFAGHRWHPYAIATQDEPLIYRERCLRCDKRRQAKERP